MNRRPLMLAITLAIGAMSMTAAGQIAVSYTPENAPAAIPANTAKNAEIIDANSTLNTRVKSAMKTHYNLASFNISVITRAGIVHLSGKVPSSVLIDQAESVVGDVEGVREVDNQLTVSGS